MDPKLLPVVYSDIYFLYIKPILWEVISIQQSTSSSKINQLIYWVVYDNINFIFYYQLIWGYHIFRPQSWLSALAFVWKYIGAINLMVSQQWCDNSTNIAAFHWRLDHATHHTFFILLSVRNSKLFEKQEKWWWGCREYPHPPYISCLLKRTDFLLLAPVMTIWIETLIGHWFYS